MLIQRIIHYPALGKNAELLAALEERNTAANAAGSPHSLGMTMFAPELAYVDQIRHADLAAIEAYQARNAADPAFQAWSSKLTGLLARPQAQELWDVLVAPQPTTAPRFAVHVVAQPALGKGPELRKTLEERSRTEAPGLAGSGLAMQLAAPETPTYAVTLLFASLADADTYRAHVAQDAGFAAYQAKLAGLLGRPVQQQMVRIVRPFPPM